MKRRLLPPTARPLATATPNPGQIELSTALKTAVLSLKDTWKRPRPYNQDEQQRMQRESDAARRRLLASKCPQCSALGSYTLWQTSGLSYMQCSHCNYRSPNL